jgi:FAD/FMN-containing dehydrogenase
MGMKKPFLRDLQGQLLGHVTDAAEVLDYFSTDASIFQVRPTVVVYPKNTADVRRTVLAALERQASDKPISVTARGAGTDLGGAALGDGLVIAFPAHMNKVLDMDRRTITVQPGANLWTVQQLLHAQARFLPPFPDSLHFSTVGGAVANNAAGIKSVKYGSMRDYVRRLKVVLADGSLVTFGRLTARQLQRKKGQPDLEGEIYRRIDSLVTDHRRLFEQSRPKTLLNAAGYALERIKGSDGSIDLAQLIIGSQGTLGLSGSRIF